ncbi:MAG TPA: hypothetical protein VLH08_21740 [Acidobacteriota bacterium]|nr:hypothetical protein [Acidobacteriota bacterium]
MQIEVSGAEPFLKEFFVYLEKELKREGFNEGPQAAFMGATHINTFVKGGIVVTSQIKESDSGECVFHLECEKESAELSEIWDKACIEYGKTLQKRIYDMAQDPIYVKNGLK